MLSRHLRSLISFTPCRLAVLNHIQASRNQTSAIGGGSTNATSVSDKASFPGYKGEFSTSLDFIYPENSPQIQCYRVMNRKGVLLDASQDPQFDRETSERLLKTMIVLSKLDQIMYEAQRQGRISFYMPNSGETAAQLGSAHALDPKDLVFGKVAFSFKISN